MSGSQLFSGSVVRALDFYPHRPGSIPMRGGKFFQLCFIPLLWLSCRKIHHFFFICYSCQQSFSHVVTVCMWQMTKSNQQYVFIVQNAMHFLSTGCFQHMFSCRIRKTSILFSWKKSYNWSCLFVLRFYGPVNPMGSCRAGSVYLTTCLLGRFSPLSG